ncbi:hypothetical protein R6Q57_006848 [Mikania cordata]
MAATMMWNHLWRLVEFTASLFSTMIFILDCCINSDIRISDTSALIGLGCYIASAHGRPYIQPNVICIFEGYAGDVGWRHSEIPVMGFDIKESRPKVTLVARMVASVGNYIYDYIFYWEFQTDGVIRIKVHVDDSRN